MQGADLLTERESAILRLVADGLSNRDIAAQLALSVNTVKWYVQQIFQKLGVQRRTQAVALLRQSGERATPGLPAPLTPLVGRERELSELLSLLGSSVTRLVSLVGAGGIGKTRLAQAIAVSWEQDQPEPVCWVALDGLASSDQLVPAIGAALGFQFGDRADPRSQLLAGLRHRSLLLVLDNFEHLLDAAPLVTDLLAAAPGLRVLATSRERLNLRGEVVYRLDGLAFPQLAEDFQAFSAVQLFVQVARRARPAYDPSPLDVGYIARICGLTEGMPLAIELAAAWTDVLEPERIAREIEAGIAILKTHARDVPDRHRSMQAAFEHSWRLLSAEEQVAFSKLAVFRGGFDRRAAEAVAGASLFLLSTLVDKSLVMRVGSDRYKLHDLLRQFAEDKLKADIGQYERILDQHCHHYGALAQEYEEEFKTHASLIVDGINRLNRDYDNILAGWRRAVELPLIAEIGPYLLGGSMLFTKYGQFAASLNMLQQALRHMEAHHDRVSMADRLQALTLCGMFSDTVSDYEAGEKLFQEALSLTETQPELLETAPHIVCLLLSFASWNALFVHDFPQARALVERSLALSHDTHFEFGIWQAQATLGLIELAAGDYAAARRAHDESLQSARRYEDLSGIVCSLALLACGCSIQDDEVQARDLMRQSLDLSRQFFVADALCMIVIAFALLDEQHGQPETALDTLVILLHHPQCGGLSRMKIELLLARCRAQLSPAQVEAALVRASQRQLSTPLLEPDFVIDATLIDHLLLALDDLPLP